MPAEYRNNPAVTTADRRLLNWQRTGISGYTGALHPGGDIDIAAIIEQARRDLAQFKLDQQQPRQEKILRTDGHVPLLLGDTI
jgi:hypothetical protein